MYVFEDCRLLDERLERLDERLGLLERLEQEDGILYMYDAENEFTASAHT